MYRPIRDYGLIGNCHTAALISSEGSLDWGCLPRFDSPAVFCRLLDDQIGGYFQIKPAGKFSVSRSYLEFSAVLATTFGGAAGKARLIDFMPVAKRQDEGEKKADAVLLYRIIEGLSGEVEFDLEWKPTFDYARVTSVIGLFEGGASAQAPNESVILLGDAGLARGISGVVHGHFRVKEGTKVAFLMAFGEGTPLSPDSLWPLHRNTEEALSAALNHWREWSDRCTYHGKYRDLVRRSAVTLKLLTYEPTGALIAAPTMSLPERIGGGRNWDYRYSWLRDSALTLHALMNLGYHDESKAFLKWIETILVGERQQNIQIAYRVDGGTDLTESELDHLSGYRGSRPVRLGNGAVHQKQWDVFGEVLDSAHFCFDLMWRPVSAGLWRALSYLADQACALWRTPDNGIWEVRGGPRHFLCSKLYCWVAVDRALKLCERGNLQADIVGWRKARDEIRQAILSEGFNTDVGAFTQSFRGQALDASALMIPIVGFLPASDPRVLSTMEQIKERLTSHGLVYRYLNEDGLPGNEAVFAVCTFWLVDNLALSGRLQEAVALFEKVVSYANDLGLLSEELDPVTGELLGNFPQGFTHLGLIRSAVRLG